MIMGVIADDLTGAVETAGMLAQGGASVALVTSAAAVVEAAEADVIVVALQSRVAPREEAVATFEEAGRALLARGAGRLFYKYCATFDSTPAGNIGPCTDVLGTLTGSRGTLFCPTFPEAERTVYRGHHFVGDLLLSESPKRNDPLTPMTEPNLVKVLQPQTRTRVGLVPLPAVAAGAEAICARVEALRADGMPYAIVDASSHDHLAAIAAATVEWPLMTGGSSVAAHYPALWRSRGWIGEHVQAPQKSRGGPILVLAGSCADRTREQIVHFEARHPVLRLDVLDERSVEAIAEHAVAWMAERGGRPVCMATGGDPATVEAAQAGLGRDGAARRGEQILSTIARRAVDQGISRVIVAGGETSGAVVSALGIRQLLVASYTSPGVGICFAEQPRPLALCLKSGKLGSEDLFLTALSEGDGHHV